MKKTLARYIPPTKDICFLKKKKCQWNYHENRNNNFLKNARFVRFSEGKYFNSIIYLQNLCEYVVSAINDYDLQPADIYLPSTIVEKGDYYKIDGLAIYFPNILRPTEDILNTRKETVPISADDFKFFEEVEIEKCLASTQFIRDSYFLYNKSNLIKRSFITELNKFISICGSISCFDSKNTHKTAEIVSSNNPLEFFLEKIFS